MNTTFPLGLTEEKAGLRGKGAGEVSDFLIEKIKTSYELKSSHEEELAVRSLERYVILTAIDRLWQEHLYAMDSLREAVYLRAYGQKDPLVEYKNEAYEMFVELMGNIKNEVLNNLFRSTSNLLAFEKFLSNLPHFLQGHNAPTPASPAGATATTTTSSGVPAPEPDPDMQLPLRRELPKAGRNDPCPCGSGKKFKNCCGRMA